MNAKCPLVIAFAGLALVFAGCATSNLPRVTYPVTYQIHLGNTQVSSAYGPQNLNVNATQDVTAGAGEPLYYRVNSPVPVNVYVYAENSAGTYAYLGQNQGNLFDASVTPPSSSVRFVFSVAEANTSGVLQFTISDEPIPPLSPPAVVSPPPPPPPPPP